MITESTVSAKFQTTLPKSIVKRLGVRPSDRIIYQCEGPMVLLRVKKGSLHDAMARFPKRGQRAVSLEEMQKAIEEEAVARFERS